MKFLELNNISRHFGGLVAVDDVDATMEEGEILGIMGPNGAGKTTLFNLISGFLKATRGRIWFQGNDITNLKPHTVVEKGIAKTFQLNTIFSGMTVLENILVACQIVYQVGFWESILNLSSSRKKENKMRENALHVMELMNLSGFADRNASTLPHGQQRSLSIAIALMTRPKLLLLDEPCCGMTAEETAEMLNRIRNLNAKGTNIILIEHNVNAVMSLCGKIFVMNFGRKIAEGTPNQIRRDKRVVEAYLGG